MTATRDQNRDELRARLAPAAAASARAKQARVLGGALGKAKDALHRAARAAERLGAAAADEARLLLERVAALAAPSVATEDRWAVAREVRVLRDEGVESQRIARALLDLGTCKACGGGRVRDIRRCQTWLRKERQLLRERDALDVASRQSADGGFRLDAGAVSMGAAVISTAEQEPNMAKTDPTIRKRITTTTTVEEQFEHHPTDAALDDPVEPDDEAEDAEDDADE